MSTRKRVLVLTSTFPRWEGDTEPPFVFELSRRLGIQCDVMVLAPHTSGAARRENIGNLDVYRFRYFFTSWQSLAYHGGIMANLKQNRLRYLLIPFFMLSELFSLLALLKKLKIDVIHAHWLIPQGLVAIVACAFITGNKPAVVCTSHGTDLFGLTGIMFRWLQKKVITRVDKLTVVSTAMREHAITLVNRHDIEVIPMGVDLTENFTLTSTLVRSCNELLFVGRLVEQKGLKYLIQAMPDILKKHSQASLTIVGDGPESEGLKRLARDVGVSEQVRFLGAVENIALKELYGRAAMFVSPSLAEGFGLTLVEALGCGCPVVATDLPALRDVVIDDSTGVICRQRDSADIARVILLLLDNEPKRRELARAGRQHVVERFGWDVIGQQHLSLIDSLSAK